MATKVDKRARRYVGSLAEKLRLQQQGYTNVVVDVMRAQQQVIDNRKRTNARRTTKKVAAASTPTRVVENPREDAFARAVGRGTAPDVSPKPLDLRDPAQVRWIQTQLKNAGYYTGRIDGIWGPKSQAANDAWNRDGRPDRRPTSASSGGGDVTGGVGGFAESPAAGGSPSPAANPTPAPGSADWKQLVRERYPQMAGFLNIPDVSAVLEAAIAEGWPPDKMAARIQATDWWRTTPAKARAWLGLYALDPASAERKIDEEVGELKKLQRAYLVPLADVTLREWAKKGLSGEIPADGFLGYVKEQAKSLFPTLASAIDRGVTVEQYVDPYRQVAARALEINPDQIDFLDTKWQRAVTQVSPQGERVAMSLADWESELKRNPIYGWDRTRNARETAAQFATHLGQLFGKVA